MKKLTLIVILLLSIAVAPVVAQDDMADVSVFLPFIPNIQFAPMYVAIEKGYFAEAGLNVTLEYGSEPDGLELIATGDLDYGVFGGEQVILARSGERPVVFVYEWYQRNPIAIVVPLQADEETIATPDALADLTVGVPGRFGATYSSLTALLTAAELTETDINLQEIGFNAPDVVCVGGVDAAAVYINNEPLQIRNRAQAGDCGDVADVEVIPVADFADLVSNGMVASEATIADNPAQVQAFVTAFDMALQDTINNPAEAYMLSVPHIEGLPYESADVFEAAAADMQIDPDALAADLTADEFLQLEVLLTTIPLWLAETPGTTDADSWELTQQTLIDMGFQSEPVALDAAFTNNFVPGLQ
ncbi:MAG: ABC transporter substrate-binding protein [Chloroflexota bacterium]